MSTTNPSAQTALLVMDVQPSTVERYAHNSDLLARLATTIAAARAANIPVIYVRVKFRQGYPEVSPRNKLFAGIKQRSSSFQGAMMAMEIHPAIAPLPTDSVVTKLRVSAFAGSDLEVLLRAQDIRHLVLCGIATSGVVLSTLREAADENHNECRRNINVT